MSGWYPLTAPRDQGPDRVVPDVELWRDLVHDELTRMNLWWSAADRVDVVPGEMWESTSWPRFDPFPRLTRLAAARREARRRVDLAWRALRGETFEE